MNHTWRYILVACGLCLGAISPGTSAQSPTSRPIAGAGHFSEDVFNMLFSHPIEESEWVRERVNRATSTGQGHLEGRVTIDMVPNHSRGRLDFVLQANLDVPHAKAVQRQVRVHAHTQSRVTGRKSLLFDRDGLEVLPATAQSPTQIQIRDVQARRRLIERLATRRTYRQKSEVEGMLAQRTSSRIEERLDERIGEAMETFESRLGEFLQDEGIDDSVFPHEASFRSTDRHLQLWIDAHADQVISEPADASVLDPSLDIHVVVHQQVFGGFAACRAAGRRIQDEEVLRFVEMARGSAPWSLWVHSRRPRWSVQLAAERPLEVRVAEGNLYTTIVLDEFRYGEEVLPGPIQVELTLRPEIAADGPRLHRLAGPEVQLHRRVPQTEKVESNGDAETRLTDLLRQKFEGVFPEFFYFDSMQPPSGGSWEKMRSLRLERLTAEREWFEIGYQFQAEPTPTINVAVAD